MKFKCEKCGKLIFFLIKYVSGYKSSTCELDGENLEYSNRTDWEEDGEVEEHCCEECEECGEVLAVGEIMAMKYIKEHLTIKSKKEMMARIMEKENE